MNKAKSIENHLKNLIIGEEVEGDDKYVKSAYTMYKHLHPIIRTNSYSAYKPSAGDVLYSNRAEPKTDLVIVEELLNTKHSISIKENDGAYIVSCNSQRDFITQMIDIHDGLNILSPEMIIRLRKCAEYIKKVPNFNSYNKKYQKYNRLREYVNDYFISRSKDILGIEMAEECGEYIISCYENVDKQNEYVEYLHESESYIQETMRDLFVDYPEYSKKIIFEFMTGRQKFYGDECSSEYLVSNEGLFLLDNHNCDYVNRHYNTLINRKNIGRLQNVPRKTVTEKTLLSGNIEKIANEFSRADFTFKL